jgi:hypothetical protein
LVVYDATIYGHYQNGKSWLYIAVCVIWVGRLRWFTMIVTIIMSAGSIRYKNVILNRYRSLFRPYKAGADRANSAWNLWEFSIILFFASFYGQNW